VHATSICQSVAINILSTNHRELCDGMKLLITKLFSSIT